MQKKNKLLCVAVIYIVFIVISIVASFNNIIYAALGNKLIYKGISLAGAEFGHNNIPGTPGIDYIYPKQDEIDYFINKGMTTIRLPFLWERLQNSLRAELSSDIEYIDEIVNYVTSRGAYTLLDPHNYARYHKKVIGEPESGVTADDFADFWSRLATRYKDNPKVIFGLMNEPMGIDTRVWRVNAQAAINAIRATGATNLITVPGSNWTSAFSWLERNYATSNAAEMLKITDPADNFCFEAHQYFDKNHSGSNDSNHSHSFESHLIRFTEWGRQHGKKAILGEFNFDDSEASLVMGDALLTYLEENSDVWLGWIDWAGGPWWRNSPRVLTPYPFPGGADKPAMAVFSKHLNPQANMPTTPLTPTAEKPPVLEVR